MAARISAFSEVDSKLRVLLSEKLRACDDALVLPQGHVSVESGSAKCVVDESSHLRFNDTNGSAYDTFSCALPRHAAGTFAVEVYVEGKGLARAADTSVDLMFAFGLRLDSSTPGLVSVLGGATFTMRGAGFARCEPSGDATVP